MDALEQQADSVQITAVIPRPEKGVITCEDDCKPWTSYMDEQAKCAKLTKEQFAPIKQAADRRHKSICAKEAAILEQFMSGVSEADEVLKAWHVAEDRRRAEKQVHLDEIARQEAIAKAEANGDHQEAARIATGKVAVVSDQVVPPVKIKGFSVRMVKKGRVVSMPDFVRACLAGRNGLGVRLLVPEQGALDKLIQAMPPGTEFPGVQVYEEPQSRRTSRV
jgi:hypothetical protein